MITENSVLNTRYRLEKKIGQGGFALVYLAMDQLLKRRVAVKVLNSELTEDENFLARFEREAQSIAALEHPNILTVYDYGQAEDTAYLVTPYVEGGTLHDKLRTQKKFSLQEASQYLTQVAAALDYAHRRFIVHRDIKPQNMLLRTEDDRLLLGDFGIAKVLSSSSAQSRTGVMGTISYMAPEQLEGNVGVGTDIYALGCVLFQMLTGELPYTGPTEQVMMGHIMRPIPSIIERSQGQLPAAVQDVINRALAKKPEDRYPSAGEMAKAFQAIVVSNTTGNVQVPASPSDPTRVVGYSTSSNQPTQYNQPLPQGPVRGGTPPYGNVPPGGIPTQGYNGTPPYGNVPPIGTSPYPYGGAQHAPKKSNTGLIVGIGAVAMAVIVAIVIIAIAAGGNKDSTPTSQAIITSTPATGNNGTVTKIAVGNTTVATNSANVPSGWKEYTSAEGGFSVIMPGNPTRQTQSVNTTAGAVDVIYFQGSQNSNQVNFTVSFADYPEDAVGSADEDAILDGVLTGQQQSLNATNVTNTGKISLGSVPGRQATFNIKQGSTSGVAISRAYLDGNRLYQILAIYATGKKPADSDLDTFFNSFKITG